uniref:Uncharacterized protein n=1 Tax=Trypanosoma congolense (strain IL3000) TaxID=1068625 RepID=G0UTQ0_TRYCI|nr:conserved hypothetical protein [Trypanosoma congolense IL3000]
MAFFCVVYFPSALSPLMSFFFFFCHCHPKPIVFTPYESQECDARLQFVSHRMVGSAGIAAFGRVRVLFRHNGVSEVVEVGDAVQLDSAIALLQSFPTVPKSYTALCTPTLAEVHGEVTSVASTVASGVLRQSKTVDFAWLEVETNSDVVLKKVLSAFPVHAKTVELICSGENTTELVEIFPTCGYIWINVAAKVSVGKVENQSEVGTTAVSMVAFEHFLLTVHRGSLVGYEDMGAYMELFVKSPASLGCPVPTVICSLVSGFVKEYRKELLPLLVDVDNVNEMVLEIQPSQCDQLDLLRRIDDLRHALSRVQASYFAKERVVQRLLLPFVRRTFMTSEPGVAARYQRLLSGILLSIERLRKGRDVLNMSSMSLVSGVSMRLLQHCYWMDYLNNVLTMMTLVSMPVCIIPGLFTMNVRVPFEGSEGHGPFYAVAIVTAAFFFFGMSYPAYLYLKFKSPDALVPVSQP